MKARYSPHYKCKHDGCSEWTFSEYTNRKDYDRGRTHRENWKCTRHSRPDSVLSMDRLTITKEMVSTRSERADGLYFGSSGFVHGHGWKAWAKDFPEGTKIIETVTVILPKDEG